MFCYIPFDYYINDDGDAQTQSTTSPSTIRKISKIKATTSCEICGAPTYNLHYKVISCNSCKTFFRRCVVSSTFFKCKNDKNCDLDHNNQPYNSCKGCRLGRCITIGMNPEAMQYPTNVDFQTCLEKFYEFKNEILPSYMVKKLTSPHEAIYNEIISLLYVEDKFRKIRESTYEPGDIVFKSIQDLLMRRSEISQAEKYDKPKEWPYSMKTIYEHMANHLKNFAFSDEKFPRPTGKAWNAIDSILVMEVAKTLPFFRLMDINDQVIVLRHATLVNTILTESFYSFSTNQETIVMPDGIIPFRILSEFNKIAAENKYTGLISIVNEFKKSIDAIKLNKANIFFKLRANFQSMSNAILEDLYIKVLEPLRRVNLSEKEYVLIKTLIYSYHDLPNISDHARTILREHFEKYSQLLLKHVQMEYGEFQGAQKYAGVISLINTFFQVANKHRQRFLLYEVTTGMDSDMDFLRSPRLIQEIMLIR